MKIPAPSLSPQPLPTLEQLSRQRDQERKEWQSLNAKTTADLEAKRRAGIRARNANATASVTEIAESLSWKGASKTTEISSNTREEIRRRVEAAEKAGGQIVTDAIVGKFF